MLDEETKKFVEDFMLFSCKYCWDVKNFRECNSIYTKCIDKALFLAYKFCNKGWIREDADGESTETKETKEIQESQS